MLNPSYVLYFGDTFWSSISIDASPFPQAYLLYEGDGDNHHKECNISMQWTRHGYYRIEYTYTISNVTFSDVGRYTLTVSNSQGTFLYQFSINIIDNDIDCSNVILQTAILTTVATVCLVMVIVSSVCKLRKWYSAVKMELTGEQNGGSDQSKRGSFSDEHYTNIDPPKSDDPNGYFIAAPIEQPNGTSDLSGGDASNAYLSAISKEAKTENDLVGMSAPNADVTIIPEEESGRISEIFDPTEKGVQNYYELTELK
ncbi:uncharacterized protein LOC117339094 [Pecten maximus]|uniref:uncharacterized protein LOC117339094 n=1 Tax=Pecten maximus TaxID=6579 RepID=UPI0014584B51|nr:uncharacterized protein LOC117339094 [Pecten maximus]